MSRQCGVGESGSFVSLSNINVSVSSTRTAELLSPNPKAEIPGFTADRRDSRGTL